MSIYLSVAQIVVSILLVGSILLQSRGSGLSGTFGGQGTVYQTRRGIERSLFMSSVVLSIIFFALSFLNILIK